ncbi:MAG: SRPBCC domain-containing protein [Rhodoglobus sp.]
MTDHIASSEITVSVPPSRVWNALTDPKQVKQFMFGTDLITDWQPGGQIAWRGEWEGKPYEDHGVVLDFEPETLLRVTHYSPLGGEPDIPENYHTLTYTLEPKGEGTLITLTQDNNPSAEAQAHSEEMWTSMLASLSEHLEK